MPLWSYISSRGNWFSSTTDETSQNICTNSPKDQLLYQFLSNHDRKTCSICKKYNFGKKNYSNSILNKHRQYFVHITTPQQRLDLLEQMIYYVYNANYNLSKKIIPSQKKNFSSQVKNKGNCIYLRSKKPKSVTQSHKNICNKNNKRFVYYIKLEKSKNNNNSKKLYYYKYVKPIPLPILSISSSNNKSIADLTFLPNITSDSEFSSISSPDSSSPSSTSTSSSPNQLPPSTLPSTEVLNVEPINGVLGYIVPIVSTIVAKLTTPHNIRRVQRSMRYLATLGKQYRPVIASIRRSTTCGSRKRIDTTTKSPTSRRYSQTLHDDDSDDNDIELLHYNDEFYHENEHLDNNIDEGDDQENQSKEKKMYHNHEKRNIEDGCDVGCKTNDICSCCSGEYDNTDVCISYTLNHSHIYEYHHHHNDEDGDGDDYSIHHDEDNNSIMNYNNITHSIGSQHYDDDGENNFISHNTNQSITDEYNNTQYTNNNNNNNNTYQSNDYYDKSIKKRLSQPNIFSTVEHHVMLPYSSNHHTIHSSSPTPSSSPSSSIKTAAMHTTNTNNNNSQSNFSMTKPCKISKQNTHTNPTITTYILNSHYIMKMQSRNSSSATCDFPSTQANIIKHAALSNTIQTNGGSASSPSSPSSPIISQSSSQLSSQSSSPSSPSSPSCQLIPISSPPQRPSSSVSNISRSSPLLSTHTLCHSLPSSPSVITLPVSTKGIHTATLSNHKNATDEMKIDTSDTIDATDSDACRDGDASHDSDATDGDASDDTNHSNTNTPTTKDTNSTTILSNSNNNNEQTSIPEIKQITNKKNDTQQKMNKQINTYNKHFDISCNTHTIPLYQHISSTLAQLLSHKLTCCCSDCFSALFSLCEQIAFVNTLYKQKIHQQPIDNESQQEITQKQNTEKIEKEKEENPEENVNEMNNNIQLSFEQTLDIQASITYYRDQLGRYIIPNSQMKTHSQQQQSQNIQPENNNNNAIDNINNNTISIKNLRINTPPQHNDDIVIFDTTSLKLTSLSIENTTQCTLEKKYDIVNNIVQNNDEIVEELIVSPFI